MSLRNPCDASSCSAMRSESAFYAQRCWAQSGVVGLLKPERMLATLPLVSDRVGLDVPVPARAESQHTVEQAMWSERLRFAVRVMPSMPFLALFPGIVSAR